MVFFAIIEYFKLALRSLIRRKLRSWLTMIGIFIGIAAVISLIGLGDGLRQAISGEFGTLGPDVLTIQASGLNYAGPPGSATPNPLTKDLAKKIDAVNGVDVAINRYIAIGTMDFNHNQGIGFAVSMPSGDQRKKLEAMNGFKAQQGRLLKDGDTKSVVLGADFAKDNNGFGKPLMPGDKVLLNGKQFQVVGILESQGSFTTDMAVFVNEDTLINELNKGNDNDVNIIVVKVKDVSQINSVQSDIEKLLRKERHVKVGEEDFTVQSSQATLQSLNSSLFAVQLFVIIIASISLLVGGIGITNTMYTAVLERTKEIGILKSIGAKNSAVFSLFAIESGMLGLVGGIIGVTLGLILAYGLAYIGTATLGTNLIQVQISTLLIFGSLMFSFALGFLAGVLPAIRASKKRPIDALRS